MSKMSCFGINVVLFLLMVVVGLANGQDKCIKSKPCKNGAACTPGKRPEQDFICTCAEDWSGRTCNKRDACYKGPCVNEGTCVLSGKTYTCNCPPKFYGNNCEKEDVCQNNPCKNKATCVSSEDGSTYTCTCLPGYFGDKCASIDKCYDNPCENGGTCVSHNQGKTYTCKCPPKVSGTKCGKEDQCNDVPCKNGATCVSSADGSTYTCTCVPGFVGDKCAKADSCSSAPCLNGGECVPRFGGKDYECACAKGYNGSNCEELMKTPCEPEIYRLIDDVNRTASVKVGGEMCDSPVEEGEGDFSEGWYRFQLNGLDATLPSKCEMISGHCHTFTTMWVDHQGHPPPKLNEEMTCRVCANQYCDKPCATCSECFFQRPVTIRNCGDFTVYKLMPVLKCPIRYCVTVTPA